MILLKTGLCHKYLCFYSMFTIISKTVVNFAILSRGVIRNKFNCKNTPENLKITFKSLLLPQKVFRKQKPVVVKLLL